MERTQGKHTIYAVIPIWNHDFLYWNNKVCWTNISYVTLKWKNKKFCTIFRVPEFEGNQSLSRAFGALFLRKKRFKISGLWNNRTIRTIWWEAISWNSIVSELFAYRSTLAHVSLSIVFEYVIFCVYLYSICFVTVWNVSKFSFFFLSLCLSGLLLISFEAKDNSFWAISKSDSFIGKKIEKTKEVAAALCLSITIFKATNIRTATNEKKSVNQMNVLDEHWTLFSLISGILVFI